MKNYRYNDNDLCDQLGKTLSQQLRLLVPYTGAHDRVGVKNIARSASIRCGALLTARVNTFLPLHQCCHCDHHHQCDQHHDKLHWYKEHCQLDITWAVADTGFPTFYQDSIVPVWFTIYFKTNVPREKLTFEWWCTNSNTQNEKA